MEKTMKSEYMFEGRLVKLRVDTVELEEKGYGRREIVEHRGGVAILAVDNQDQIIFVKQYRKAVEATVLEIPAGTREPNEEPRVTALRELKEETGYEARSWEFVGEFFPTPGYCTEKIHLFVAKDLIKGEQNLDDGEYLVVEKLPYEEALNAIAMGKIIDAKTVIAILYYEQFLKERL